MAELGLRAAVDAAPASPGRNVPHVFGSPTGSSPQPHRCGRDGAADDASGAAPDEAPNDDALWKLATWLSPAYPVGAFAYSHGLEWAVAAGDVADRASAAAWIADCIALGAGRSDAILLAHAWRAGAAGDDAALDAVAELALALAPSAERLLETEVQGAAFADVTAAAWGAGSRPDRSPPPYPVAVGLAAARHGVPLRPAVLMFLHAFASSLVSACVRLAPLGQADGQRVLAALMPLCRDVADEALSADLDVIGGCAFRADIAAMRHETQAVRLFRT